MPKFSLIDNGVHFVTVSILLLLFPLPFLLQHLLCSAEDEIGTQQPTSLFGHVWELSCPFVISVTVLFMVQISYSVFFMDLK